MIGPPLWPPDRLEQDRVRAIELFRAQRIQEPLEHYLRAFDEYRASVEELLTETSRLLDLPAVSSDVLSRRSLLEAIRYLAGPPVSEDDLKTLADTGSLAPTSLRRDPESVQRIIQVIQGAIDPRRFPWLVDGREPTAEERAAAAVATAALMAVQRVGTLRRTQEKKHQEGRVEAALVEAGLTGVPPRSVRTAAQAPEPGQFCGESLLGTRKADFILRLWDYRIMPVECKVSNSALNSVKRLNNDAAVKAEVWRKDFGATQVVPAAVLSGVYNLHNLQEAQNRGLSLFWAHDLAPLLDWIELTRHS